MRPTSFVSGEIFRAQRGSRAPCRAALKTTADYEGVARPAPLAATIVLAAGVPERVVMEILGHSTLAMVKRYQHVLPGLTVAAAERMDRVMGR